MKKILMPDQSGNRIRGTQPRHGTLPYQTVMQDAGRPMPKEGIDLVVDAQLCHLDLM
jgi:hypothetical protein